MTKYLIDCRKCTNKYIDGSGTQWCKPMADGKKAVTVSQDTAGTKDDPDIVSCGYYTLSPLQAEMYPWKGSDNGET